MIGRKKTMPYAEVETLLSRVTSPISLYLTPVNYERERERFFESSTYNPQFRYRPWKRNDAAFSVLRHVTEVTDIDPELSKYIINVIADKQQAVNLLASIGRDGDFVTISQDRFGLPSAKLFARACKILRRQYGDVRLAQRNKELRDRMLTFDEVESLFTTVFEVFGLEGWTVGKSKGIVSQGFRTAAKTKRIMIDPDVVISAEKIRKTIVHEIVTHALRSQNGFATGYEFLGKPNVSEYLDDEEGLATFNEERFGVLREIDLRRKAATVYAMYIGRYSSFRQVFDAVSAVYPKRNAFDVVFKVKRGLSDTSQPGCYYKDAAYLRGFFKVRKRLATDETGYRNMYAGKIPMKYLYLVEEGIIPKPKVYPTPELVTKVLKAGGLV
ncbi:MAG: DUF1704 domain-containing protein [Candidatus Dojkabacteria bacterium]|nr:DUF1704 domain-containing protein [Candidatus Dojkabacteria bacterium]